MINKEILINKLNLEKDKWEIMMNSSANKFTQEGKIEHKEEYYRHYGRIQGILKAIDIITNEILENDTR